MKPTTPRTTRRAAGFTLLEMVLSMTVLTVAFAAVGSVFVLAGHVMPKPDSAEASSVEQSAALSRIIEDLQVARYITGGSANSITFVVDDRTGDGLPERITYAWSGIAGDPLTYTINDAPRVTIAENVRAFSIWAESETRTDQVAGTYDVSDEQVLQSHTTPTVAETASITRDWWVGQRVTPVLPQDAVSYTVSRVRARARSSGVASGWFYARVRSFDDAAMALGATQAEIAVRENQLATSYTWTSFNFTSAPSFPAGSSSAVTFEWDQGFAAADFEYDSAGGSNLLWTTAGGSPWSLYANNGMVVEVLGTVTTSTPSVELTRTVLTRAEVTLKIGDAPAQTAAARLYCEPGVHSAVWDAGFEASPVGIDMDGNGADFAAQSGGAAGSFSGGQWDVDGLLYTKPTHNFDQPMVVDLAMGATSTNRTGADFQINADQQGGNAIPLTVRVGRDNAGVYCVKVYDTSAMTTPRLDITELGQNAPQVRLLIVPADDAVALIVNGQPAGSFIYEPVAAGGLPGLAKLSEGSAGFFDHVSIRVGGSATVTLPDGGTSNSGDSGGGDGGGGGGLLGGILGGLGL